MTDWLILRTASGSTLPLARSLEASGFDVWTPVEVVTKRVTEMTVKRRVPIALLPGYLFARAHQMMDLFALSNHPAKQHRDFRVMRQSGKIPLIADETLDPLRTYQRKHMPMERPLQTGEPVRMTEGAYAGLRGTVERLQGKKAVVAIVGFPKPLEVAAWLLLRDVEPGVMRAVA